MNQKNEGLICADSRFRGSIKTPVSSAACCKKADWGRVLLYGGPFFSRMRINWGFPVDEKSKWSEPWLLCRNCDRVADALSLQKIRNHRQKIQSTNDPRRKLFCLPQASWLLASRGPANPSHKQGSPGRAFPRWQLSIGASNLHAEKRAFMVDTYCRLHNAVYLRSPFGTIKSSLSLPWTDQSWLFPQYSFVFFMS